MALFEQRVSEPKLAKDGVTIVRTVKLGNRLLGQIEAQKVKPGEKSVNTFWASPLSSKLRELDIMVGKTAISGIKAYGVTMVGLRFPDGSSYLTTLDRVLSAEQPRTSSFYLVSHSEWDITLPPENIRAILLMEKMRVGRRRKSTTAELVASMSV